MTTSFSAMAVNHCIRYEKNIDKASLIQQLSKRLSYQYNELCTLERIADIQFEERRKFHKDTNEYENHQVVTLHYWEYSCEYHFNLDRKQWNREFDYCYSTF